MTSVIAPTQLFAQVKNGTFDAGGGNATCGRTYESAIWDVKHETVFIHKLKPLFRKLFNSAENPDGINVLNLKTWRKFCHYDPTVDEKITSSVIGVSVNENENIQVALHKKMAIEFFLDNFDKLENDDEKAKIILHEVIMLVYFKLKGEYPLDERDYRNIQEITKFLYEHGMTEKPEIIKSFINKYNPEIFGDSYFGDDFFYFTKYPAEKFIRPGQCVIHCRYTAHFINKDGPFFCDLAIVHEAEHEEVAPEWAILKKFESNEALSTAKDKVFNYLPELFRQKLCVGNIKYFLN